MITSNDIKLISKLSETKYRRSTNLFKVEGVKAVKDTIGHFQLEKLIATPAWIEENASWTNDYINFLFKASSRDLSRMSSFATPPDVIAVYKIPERNIDIDDIDSDQLIVALDCIQDPGNLGTIIRTCDWFGVRTIICSRDTVDVFNPKTIQATMGAISRVKVIPVDLYECFQLFRKKKIPIYATLLEGENIFDASLTAGGIIVMGNEGKGVSTSLLAEATRNITIPSYPRDCKTSESLNVGIATSIILSQFRMRIF